MSRTAASIATAGLLLFFQLQRNTAQVHEVLYSGIIITPIGLNGQLPGSGLQISAADFVGLINRPVLIIFAGGPRRKVQQGRRQIQAHQQDKQQAAT
ncbi:hypothetical protein [Sporomusa sp. KB1]|uniref:hypothetical protein n=1 Tax=Sporomusa sp. KB1 TaxID=943346 RepID=UPI001646C85E|nr:hypothetical protein [Sporomusa sp. KB1]